MVWSSIASRGKVEVREDFDRLYENYEEGWIILGSRIQNLPSVVKVVLVLLIVYDLVHLMNELEGYNKDDLYKMASV
jgi:hypothetical protein